MFVNTDKGGAGVAWKCQTCSQHRYGHRLLESCSPNPITSAVELQSRGTEEPGFGLLEITWGCERVARGYYKTGESFDKKTCDRFNSPANVEAEAVLESCGARSLI